MLKTNNKKIFIFSSVSESLILFRKELIEELNIKGFSIYAISPNLNQNNFYTKSLCKMNVKLINIPLIGAKISPIRDILIVLILLFHFVWHRPKYILSYNLKPIVFGNLLAYLLNIKNRFIIVTGVGYFFLDENKDKLISKLVKFFYSLSLKASSKIFFQNSDDKKLFIKLFKIPDEKTILINGSGVNLDFYKESALPDKINFLLIARLIKSKGIIEYLEAARTIKNKYPEVEFHLVGFYENNIDKIDKEKISKMVSSNIVKFHGKTDDVRPFINACSTYVLPSYREGTPRTVLEAMSIGRPIITTNVPGCKETVIDNFNGYLIEPQSVRSLVDSINKVLKLDRKSLIMMAKNSRKLAEEKYDVHKVNSIIIQNLEKNA